MVNLHNFSFRPSSTRRKTPFLMLSKGTITTKINEFRNGGATSGIFYAVKANPNPALLYFLHLQGIGFEIATEKELKTLLRLEVPIDKIISSNTVKSPSFIEKAYQAGMRRFVIDSSTEVRKIHRYAPNSTLVIRLAVDNTGSEWPLDRKFGAESHEIAGLFREGEELGLEPEGITFHVGSQCTTEDSWHKALNKVSKVWWSLREQGTQLRTLNVGGGFPIRYTSDVPSVSRIIELLHKETGALFPREVSVEAEPGRALVGDAGILVSRVIGKAFRGQENWLYLDVGVFNGLAEVLGGIRYQFSTVATGPEKAWTIGGPSCDGLDIIDEGVWLAEPAVGDRVFVMAAGAYTTAYASSFNGSPIPRVYLSDD